MTGSALFAIVALSASFGCSERTIVRPSDILRPDPGTGPVDTGADTDSETSDSGATDTDSGADSGTTDTDTDTSDDSSTRYVIAPDYLNMRAGPSGSDAVLRALHCGTAVTVTGDADGNWLPVTAEGDSGWVKGSYLARPSDLSSDPCPGPDPYLDDAPGRVVDALDVTPYVEQSCRDTTFDGWPFDAKRCDYNGGLRVTVANPSPEMVTQWIADASQMIPALWSLEARDRDAWKRGLEVIAMHTMYQSSRIFPLDGEVDEGIVYDFSRGVTEGCSTGCYCRINSTTRQQYCAYADEVLGIVDERDCLDEYSTSSWTEEWADHCLDNHRAAWTGVHHHYRAMAYWANQYVEAEFPNPERADPDAVIDLLENLY